MNVERLPDDALLVKIHALHGQIEEVERRIQCQHSQLSTLRKQYGQCHQEWILRRLRREADRKEGKC